MSEMKKIAIIENDIEAQMLESLLQEKEIPHLFKCYHDTAYDGLFQGQLGWGHIEASSEHQPEILATLNELRVPPEDEA